MTGDLCVIGYRSLRHEKFFSILNDANVSHLLDVRRNPYSPNPDYQKASIANVAPNYGVKYFHVPQLGVPGAGRSIIARGEPKTFDEQMNSSAAKLAIRKLLALLNRGDSVALMCSEVNYRDCHRKELVRIIQEINPELKLKELTGQGDLRLF